MGSVITLARRAAVLVLLSLCVSLTAAAVTRTDNVVSVPDANAKTVHVVTTISGQVYLRRGGQRRDLARRNRRGRASLLR
ncbi:MAG TPA: hypothetical protein VD861_05600 [Pyrinomonadaceae bacterium]|nr:hypothetical protein [Pyrinomonadaceae bacterium]